MTCQVFWIFELDFWIFKLPNNTCHFYLEHVNWRGFLNNNLMNFCLSKVKNIAKVLSNIHTTPYTSKSLICFKTEESFLKHSTVVHRKYSCKLIKPQGSIPNMVFSVTNYLQFHSAISFYYWCYFLPSKAVNFL